MSGVTARQWRDAANVLREQAAGFDNRAEQIESLHAICGVSANAGRGGEPLACGFPLDHDGPHAWATLPTFGSTDPRPPTPTPTAETVPPRVAGTGGPQNPAQSRGSAE